ncbi:IPT/TIG domain-containing protein [Paraflavitalea sp. CAU 1676]|uniref:IPT/TIG domain-containing protein n=1 Tax=Paraflavitalea sp. CAU 1676 TaxID=3032598 RepID=UPI0023DB2BBA|nr:IPT/TIG domain-containing protein [Paraflavitalea sp. CAU 1676]MDF2193470.1 IPT/TIG domain-containing protein [Paraflavitalea sp. CAU 1676]
MKLNAMTRNRFFPVILLLPFFVLVLAGCGKNDPLSNVLLNIVAIRPLEASAGDTVEITGNGFLLDKTLNLVKFNGKSATVTTAGKNGLKVPVPVDATTGKVTITVAGITVASTDVFKVVP